MNDDRFTAHLPIGEPLPAPERTIVDWPNWPFRADGTVKELQSPVLPEPPRRGEDGTDCVTCVKTESEYLWTDDDWGVFAFDSPGVPVVMLESRPHCDFADLPPRLLASFGPMVQRVEAALLALGGIGRVQFNRWGDGSAHFHLWFHARPLGMVQLRGTALSTWDDVLPRLPDDVWTLARRDIARQLASGGGTAHW